MSKLEAWIDNGKEDDFFNDVAYAIEGMFKILFLILFPK